MSAARVIFVGQTYYPDATSSGQLYTPLLEALAAEGKDILVLCGYPLGVPSGTPVPARETRRGVRIIRCGLRIDTKKSMLHRAASYATYLLSTLMHLLCVHRGDLVFGITNPPFNAVLIWIASLVRQFRYQYMILDAYPEGLIALGRLDAGSPFARFWFVANRRAYRRASKMVVLGRDMVPVLVANYGIDPQRCVYIPHWSAAEHAEIRPIEASRSLARLGLADKFVVQYSGNMGLWHDMLALVQAADRLREHPEVHFLFIGGGIRRAEAESLARDKKLANITWRDFVPLDELDDSLSGCHVALISLRSGLEGVAVPCKLYGILAVGRAVLAQVPPQSEVALTVEEFHCGVVVPPGDVTALADAILRMSKDREETAAMGRRGRESYLTHYRLEQGKAAFAALWR